MSRLLSENIWPLLQPYDFSPNPAGLLLHRLVFYNHYMISALHVLFDCMKSNIAVYDGDQYFRFHLFFNF